MSICYWTVATVAGWDGVEPKLVKMTVSVEAESAMTTSVSVTQKSISLHKDLLH